MSRRLVCVMFGLLVVAVFAFAVDDRPEIDNVLKAQDRLFKVISEIQDEYVDSDKSEIDDLIDGAIKGMLMTLDPHSTYFPADQYRIFRETTSGHFGGLGIQIAVENGWLTVVAPLDNTPASRAGLRTGDKIVKIDGKSTRNKTVEDAVLVLRGQPGTDVTLTVYRQTGGKVDKSNVTLTREDIAVSAVSGSSVAGATGEEGGARMIADDIGFVRLAEFSSNSAEQLDRAVRHLQQKGMKALVLDLRMNSGGLLDQAVKICSLFLEPGQECVSVIPRVKSQKQVHRADNPRPYRFPVAVLVNQGSASASEIVAGAIQDHHRGIIIGPRGVNTYGKGTVQTVKDLPGGDGLKLTTARYYTPSGDSIDGTGIVPDIGVDGASLEHWVQLYTQKRIGLLPPKVRNVSGSGSLLGDLLDDPEIEAATGEESGEVEAGDVFGIAAEATSATTVAAAPAYDIELAEAVKILRAQMILSERDPVTARR